MNCYFMINVGLNVIFTAYIYMLVLSVLLHSARDQLQLEVNQSIVPLNNYVLQWVMKLVVLLIPE
jgi:hypothetical protein